MTPDSFLNQCWQQYAQKMGLGSRTTEEQEALKQAFYAGASTVASLLNNKAGELDLDTRAELMKSAIDETRAVNTATVATNVISMKNGHKH